MVGAGCEATYARTLSLPCRVTIAATIPLSLIVSPPPPYTHAAAAAAGFINGVSASIFGFQLLLVFIFGIVGDTFTDK